MLNKFKKNLTKKNLIISLIILIIIILIVILILRFRKNTSSHSIDYNLNTYTNSYNYSEDGFYTDNDLEVEVTNSAAILKYDDLKGEIVSYNPTTKESTSITILDEENNNINNKISSFEQINYNGNVYAFARDGKAHQLLTDKNTDNTYQSQVIPTKTKVSRIVKNDDNSLSNYNFVNENNMLYNSEGDLYKTWVYNYEDKIYLYKNAGVAYLSPYDVFTDDDKYTISFKYILIENDNIYLVTDKDVVYQIVSTNNSYGLSRINTFIDMLYGDYNEETKTYSTITINLKDKTTINLKNATFIDSYIIINQLYS